jgi:uncharacterized protein
MSVTQTTAPLAPHDRLPMIDALRGAALFGVLLINMMWFAGMDSESVTRATFDALPTAALDARVDDLVDLLVSAKAIGVFSLLFGVGFAMQLESLERRGVSPRRRYARRLTGLLILGLVHWLAIWSGEILHVYAVAGFIMLLLTRVRTRWLVVVGLTLAVLARPIAGRLYLLTGGDGSLLTPALDHDMAARLQVFAHGSFADAVALQFRQDIYWKLTSGTALAAVLHALGRFMIGMAVARKGFLRDPAAHWRGAAMLAAIALPVGFVLEHDWAVLSFLRDLGWQPQPLATEIFKHVCASVGVVCMTGGYVALFMLLWTLPATRRALSVFAPAGRMALTNYLSHTAINYLLFFGFGLALIGRVGITVCLALSVAVYLSQLVISRWWLKRWNYGPFEWLWRWWTHGARPPFRRVVA